jgi:hypothetical protein
VDVLNCVLLNEYRKLSCQVSRHGIFREVGLFSNNFPPNYLVSNKTLISNLLRFVQQLRVVG